MNALSFYLRVVRALEEINAPYMIVGAFAGLAFGVQRATLLLVSSRRGPRGAQPGTPTTSMPCWFLLSVA